MEEKTEKAINHLKEIFGIPVQRDETYNFVCGEDFCENCGDCLACESEFPCTHSEDGLHVVSLETLEKRKRKG